jgi:hypothetical protein
MSAIILAARRTIAAPQPVILKERPFLPRMKDLNWRSPHPPPPFSSFWCKQSTYSISPKDGPWATLGWPKGHAWATQGPPNPRPKPNPNRQRVATLAMLMWHRRPRRWSAEGQKWRFNTRSVDRRCRGPHSRAAFAREWAQSQIGRGSQRLSNTRPVDRRRPRLRLVNGRDTAVGNSIFCCKRSNRRPFEGLHP